VREGVGNALPAKRMLACQSRNGICEWSSGAAESGSNTIHHQRKTLCLPAYATKQIGVGGIDVVVEQHGKDQRISS
jgi:hypothetical protein